MDRRTFCKNTLFAASTLIFGSCRPQAKSGKTALNNHYNIIFLMADDLGPAELGCYGNKIIKTPNIDRLAAGGMRFKTCYATPVCGPTRVLLMTGRYGFRTGHFNMGDRPGGPKSYEPALDFTETETTFADMLKNNGYATAIAGKWQLVPPSFDKIPGCGFDEHMSWKIVFDEEFGGREMTPGGPGKPGSRYFHPSIFHNGKAIKTKPTDFGPDMFTGFINDFIRENTKKNKPFVAYYSMVLPHRPIGPTPDHPDQPVENSYTSLKYNVEYIDKLVGRIVDTVNKTGQRDNTVIFFVGDNGTETLGKNTPTEKGCRVPLIVNCPGLVKPGVVSDALVDFSDFMPTFAELGKAELPSDKEYDGKSLLPVLTGETSRHRDWIFSYMGQFRILRTDKWLLEEECEDFNGRFLYCGNDRTGENYKDVTDSNDPEAVSMRAKFDKILAKLPRPVLPASERARFIDYLDRYNPDYNLSQAYPKGFE